MPIFTVLGGSRFEILGRMFGGGGRTQAKLRKRMGDRRAWVSAVVVVNFGAMEAARSADCEGKHFASLLCTEAQKRPSDFNLGSGYDGVITCVVAQL